MKKQTKAAFTLIELLVVVLIIGILAAVAVPQYKKAVVKSRLSNIKTIMSAMKTAQEAYYLANGEYIDSVEDLDIGFSCTTPFDKSIAKCDDYFLIDAIQGGLPNIRAGYCPGYQTNWDSDRQTGCGFQREFIYIVWLDHSDNPGVTECIGRTDFGKAICKAEH